MPDWKAEIALLLAKCNLEPSKEAAIVEELAGHAEDRYQELMRQGATPVIAYQKTLAELSDAGWAYGVTNLDSPASPLFSRRFPFAARILLKYWKLAGVAVFSLAIAIAAGVAGLSLFNALLLRPPVAAAPSELLTVYSSTASHPADQFSVSEYRYYSDRNHVFAQLAAFNYGISVFSLSYGNNTFQAVTATVSENYFDVLGIHPLLGRLFAGDDSVSKAEVVLSYDCWKRLGADPEIAGKMVKIHGHEVLIAGVAPDRFRGLVPGFSVDAWAPILLESTLFPPSAPNLLDPNNRWLTLVGRLKPGLARRQAEADLGTLAAQLSQDSPKSNTGRTARVTPTTMMPPGSLGPVRLFSWAVVVIVLLVLVVASANVVNLLLGLAAARRQELLIRAALGATRSRLARLLLKETMWVVGVAGLLGSLLATAVLERLFAYRPVLLTGLPPLLLDFRPDFRVAGLTVAALFIMILAIGVVPSLTASIPNLAAALNGEVAAGSPRKGRARGVLVVIQTAVCTVVLVGSGLCLRSIESLKKVPLGFSARNLVSGWLDDSGYTEAQRSILYDTVRRNAEALPGVTSVTFASSLPLGGQGFASDRVAAQGQESSKDMWSDVEYSQVEGNYFAMLGMPFLAGRTFDSTDTATSTEVVVVNQALAGKYWPGHDPLGERLRIQNGNRLVQVVGVVANSKYTDLDEPQLPFIYFSVGQHRHDAHDLAVIASTRGDPRWWIEPLRDVVRQADPSMFCMVTTMDGQISMSLLLPRIIFGCVSGFGFLALVLSMAGIYATTSYSVSERKKEIGIRFALGAQPRDVMATLLRQSAFATAIGLVLGLGLGVAMSMLLGSLLYGIRPVEGGVLAIVLGLTSSIALLTAYSAALPWMKTDPLEAVRHA
jgi:predicted permease